MAAVDLRRQPAGGGDLSAGPTDLFPLLPPRVSGHLERDGGHRLYWEEGGRADGLPVVFLHGGPGAGSAPQHRQFFDPERYRVVLFDQRGAGRSTPHASIAANTTWHLVDDIEALRRHLGVSRWLVFGGSWGATLALAYGMRHPERCLGFILRGVFLGRDEEVDWFFDGMPRIFPEAGRAFARAIPPGERGDLLAAYARRLNDPDPAIHRPAARAWAAYETACSALLPSTASTLGPGLMDDDAALALARISAHYFGHRMFLAERPILDGLDALRTLPCAIVHGRYDMVCPIATSEALHRAWPGSAFVVVPDAGHSAFEPGIRAALVAATRRFAGIL